LDPAHVHVHCPVSETAEAVPAEHNPETGAETEPVPWALPHVPLVAGTEGAGVAGAASTIVPVRLAEFTSRMSPPTEPDRLVGKFPSTTVFPEVLVPPT
jgi:hypothetical protein